MQDIGERYPQWLAKHAGSLSDEELTRYTQQHQHIVEMCRLYDEDADNFTAIFSQLQKVHEVDPQGLFDAIEAVSSPEMLLWCTPRAGCPLLLTLPPREFDSEQKCVLVYADASMRHAAG